MLSTTESGKGFSLVVRKICASPSAGWFGWFGPVQTRRECFTGLGPLAGMMEFHVSSPSRMSRVLTAPYAQIELYAPTKAPELP